MQKIVLYSLPLQVNSVFLMVALMITFKTRHNASGNTDNYRWVLGTVSLTFILGITWLFGFLFFGQEPGQGIVFAYIFTILNSLQGFFIFISFCFLNKQVRTDLHRQIVNHPVCKSFYSYLLLIRTLKFNVLHLFSLCYTDISASVRELSLWLERLEGQTSAKHWSLQRNGKNKFNVEQQSVDCAIHPIAFDEFV